MAAKQGRTGCLVVLLVTILFSFLCYKMGPVYLAKVELEDEMARLVSRAGSQHMTQRAVRNNVERVARRHEFSIEPDSLKATRTQGFARAAELRVRVTFFREVDLAVFKYRFSFSYKASTFIGGF